MRTSNGLWLWLGLVACGDASQPGRRVGVSSSRDASVAECLPPAATTEELEVVEGGRITVDWPEGLVAFEPSLLGPNWRLISSGRKLVVRAPYDSSARLELVQTPVDPCSSKHRIVVWVRPLRWTRLAEWEGDAINHPDAREHPGVWIHNQHLWIYGGLAWRPEQYTVVSDLWRFDLDAGRWAEHPLGGAVPITASGRMAKVKTGSTAYYLGGLTQDQQARNDLWALDFGLEPARWRHLGPGPNPGPALNALVFDPVADRHLSACGLRNNASFHCDVFAYQDSRWAPVAAANDAPSGRIGFAYAFDSETNRLVVAAGEGGGRRLSDTWALDFSEEPARWTMLDAGEQLPLARRNGSWALDPRGHRLLLWGGTSDGLSAVPGLFLLDLDRGHEAWVRLEVADGPTPRSSGIGLYDAKRHRFIVGFGNDLRTRFTDLWALEL